MKDVSTTVYNVINNILQNGHKRRHVSTVMRSSSGLH